jgi:predicted ribosome quality control (RQC) complex YloA/Tae2 family protein
MQVDALTLAAVASEFRSTLIGARIEDVIQPTPNAVALQTYGSGRNRWLIASAHPQLARMHFTPRKPRKLVLDPPSFVMLLRKYLEGTRVIDIRQPPWERLIEIGFMVPETREHSALHGPAWLVVEIMGRLSNLILRDDSGVILGALRQVGADENRFRTIAPHISYRYPPAQTRQLPDKAVPRLLPESVTAYDLEVAGQHMLESGPLRLGRKKRPEPLLVATVLMTHMAGFGRELAAEATARALSNPTAPLTGSVAWDSVAAEVRKLAQLPATGSWQPTLVYRSSATPARPSAFAVYRPLQYGDGAILVTAESANGMLATYFEDAEWYLAIEGAKQDLRHLLHTYHERSVRKQDALLGELAMIDEMQRLRQEADILLTFQQEVPKHAASFSIDNPFSPGEDEAETLTISLDPRLSAVANANQKYDRYHKLQRASNHIPVHLHANELELARIEQLQTDLALAETPVEIAEVRSEVALAGYLRDKPAGRVAAQGHKRKGGKPGGKPGKRTAEAGTPLRRQSSDGFVVLVGKNSRQNEEVTFRQASAHDLWLHARGVPGSHVIIKSGGRRVPATTELEAAQLAAYYSQSRAASTVLVDVTEQRFVRHLTGGGPGMVTYQQEHTLHVEPIDIG